MPGSLKMATVKCLYLQSRNISTSVACLGKRNFRKFNLFGKRGTKDFKKQQKENPDPNFPAFGLHRGVRPIGYHVGNEFVTVPEMIPELIVPDLKDFKLKPYVSYKAPDVVQSEFTSKDLFDAVYSHKIVEDFKNGKLDVDGNPLEPSSEESLSPEEARLKARSTGSDIFGP